MFVTDRRRALVWPVLGLMVSAPGHAAETLEQAWDHALNHNHQIKAARTDTAASEQQLQSSRKQPLPELSVRGGYTQLSETPAALTEIEGQTAQFNTS